MAQRIQVQLIDDINGDEADETVNFGVDGTAYEIDLSTENARQLREALAPYLKKGRKARGRSGTQQRSKPSGREDTHRIRQWAKEHGYETSARGRISKTVIEAFQAANP